MIGIDIYYTHSGILKSFLIIFDIPLDTGRTVQYYRFVGGTPTGTRTEREFRQMEVLSLIVAMFAIALSYKMVADDIIRILCREQLNPVRDSRGRFVKGNPYRFKSAA